jgi:hypothetical protein
MMLQFHGQDLTQMEGQHAPGVACWLQPPSPHNAADPHDVHKDTSHDACSTSAYSYSLDAMQRTLNGANSARRQGTNSLLCAAHATWVACASVPAMFSISCCCQLVLCVTHRVTHLVLLQGPPSTAPTCRHIVKTTASAQALLVSAARLGWQVLNMMRCSWRGVHALITLWQAAA